jgi:hypothetical protein
VLQVTASLHALPSAHCLTQPAAPVQKRDKEEVSERRSRKDGSRPKAAAEEQAEGTAAAAPSGQTRSRSELPASSDAAREQQDDGVQDSEMQAEQGDRCSRAPEQAVLMMSALAAVPYLSDVYCCTRWLCVKLGLAVQQGGRMLGLAWGTNVYKQSHHLQRGQCRQHQSAMRPTASHGQEQPALSATACVMSEHRCHKSASHDAPQQSHMVYMIRCFCRLQSLGL